MKEIMKSNAFKTASIVVGVILFALINFAVGFKVGSHKALFSSQWGKNYEKNFIGQRPPLGHSGSLDSMKRDFSGRDFRNAHGIAGSIISIAEDKLIIKDRDGKENTVAVTDKTIIRKPRVEDLKIADLKVDDEVVVMGEPDESGVVLAVLIRVFDNN